MKRIYLGFGMYLMVLGLVASTGLSVKAEERLNSYWVPGTVAEPESYYGKIKVTRKDYLGKILSCCNEERWINIPVTTPSITENTEVYLEKVYLLVNTSHNTINRVEIYDGDELVKGFNRTLYGSYNYKVKENTFDLTDRNHRMKSGLNVRIRVRDYNWEDAAGFYGFILVIRDAM